jgi:hypothetical protein
MVCFSSSLISAEFLYTGFAWRDADRSGKDAVPEFCFVDHRWEKIRSLFENRISATSLKIVCLIPMQEDEEVEDETNCWHMDPGCGLCSVFSCSDAGTGRYLSADRRSGGCGSGICSSLPWARVSLGTGI